MNTTMDENKCEDIEGLDEQQDIFLGEYPIDTVLIRSETRTVHDILRRIQQKTFIMNPDFQRDFIWPEDKQSKFIESVLMRIPLPVLYLAENQTGEMIVVDGLQRLTTFNRFVNDDFSLKFPPKLGENESELNKKKFSTLPPKLQNRIEDCNLILYIIDSKVPERARLDIFERVNGGIPLTRQQMRNCLYMGKATTFLKTESQTESFMNATGNSLSTATMRDREFVNRFCAFYLLGAENYNGDMDAFLASGLKKMNTLSDGELEELSNNFRISLDNNLLIFGKHAFRKHSPNMLTRNIINASLWDIMSVGLSSYTTQEVINQMDILKGKFYSLMNESDFIASITIGTNDTKKVKLRFDKMHQLLIEVFHA